MSVVDTSQVAYRRAQGYAQPGLPEGYWLGSVTMEGDASGGTITGSLIFSEATPALNSRIYSLEQFALFTLNEDADREINLFTDNLGHDGPAALTNRWTLSTLGEAAGTNSALRPESATLLPLFLGSMRIVGIVTRIGVLLSNPGAARDYRFEAQGYWWGARAVLVDGGVKRPPNGLYPA